MIKLTRSEFDFFKNLGRDAISRHNNGNMRSRHMVLILDKEEINIVTLEENTGGFFMYKKDATLLEAISFIEKC